MKKNKYSGWEYIDLVEESDRETLTVKEAQMLHRELKKHNSGLPILMRYPDLPTWVIIIVIVLFYLCGQSQ